MTQRYSLIHGDVLDVLATLPKESVHCVVTSPPYWGLRDYGVAGQLGCEARLDCLGWATGQKCGECHVCKMVQVFREVRRVLRKDGTLWLNYGDSYVSAASGSKGNTEGFRNGKAYQANFQGIQVSGLKPKDLCMVPARVALALQADGWFLRSEIVWHKKAPMPESVTDRPTSAHEKIFLLSKAERYFYDSDAVREPHIVGNGGRQRAAMKQSFDYAERSKGYKSRHTTPDSEGNGNTGLYESGYNSAGRNLRNVWTLSQPKFRLRDDITPEQRAYVLRRISGVDCP